MLFFFFFESCVSPREIFHTVDAAAIQERLKHVREDYFSVFVSGTCLNRGVSGTEHSDDSMPTVLRVYSPRGRDQGTNSLSRCPEESDTAHQDQAQLASHAAVGEFTLLYIVPHIKDIDEEITKLIRASRSV